MSEKRLISSDSPFEAQIGYSRAVVTGSWIFVSGTTGYNYTTGIISPSIVAQAEQTLQNIQAALQQAGASMTDVVRVRYILSNAKEFEECWPVLRRWFGDVRPSATMLQAGLMKKEMRIEIEVTARKSVGSDDDEEGEP